MWVLGQPVSGSVKMAITDCWVQLQITLSNPREHIHIHIRTRDDDNKRHKPFASIVTRSNCSMQRYLIVSSDSSDWY